MSYQEVMYWKEHEGEIKGTIQTSFEDGKTFEETILRIINKFTLSREAAEEYVNKYRPSAN